MSNLPPEPLKAYLPRREAQLVRQISGLREQLAPRQAELVEIRQAMRVVGVSPSKELPDLMPDIRPLNPLAEINSLLTTSPTSLSQDAATALGGVLVELPVLPDDAEQPTPIKKLVVQALKDHFGDIGATPEQLREYFNKVFGRNVERTSLSPQLSRLKEDGVIEQEDDGTYKLTEKWKAQQEQHPLVRRPLK